MSAPSIENKIALAILSHPDDAEILCAGTLIRLHQLGWTIHMATMTPGDCGSMTQDRWAISAIRTAEAKSAATMIDATYHCLDERDGLVVYDKPSILKVTELCRSIAPTLVFTHAQDDYMMDHVQTSLLARAATFLHGAPNISARPLLQHARIPYLYYCDPIEGIDSFGRTILPTTLIDVTDQHPLKLKMLAAHASQREWLRLHHGMDQYLTAVTDHDSKRGKMIAKPFAEAFIQHRGHAYPADDLLKSLLS